MEEKTEIGDAIKRLDIIYCWKEIERLRRYEELVEFLFECDEINLMIKETEYIMDAEEAFNLMHEYNRTGELPLCKHEEYYDYE